MDNDNGFEIGFMKWFYSEYDTVKCLACGAEFNEQIIYMNRNRQGDYPKFCPECGKQHDPKDAIEYKPKYIEL